MGNGLFDKHMSVRRDAALHDLWSPVASTAEARIVPTRAAAYRRVTESIDLIAAYPQVVLAGNIKHYIVIPVCLRRVMAPEERAMFDKLRRPVCECRGAVYGFARSGRDFIMSFAGWLIMNRWLTDPEALALHVLWHDGDDAGAIKRAIKARKKRCVQGASWTKRACEGGKEFSGSPCCVPSHSLDCRLSVFVLTCALCLRHSFFSNSTSDSSIHCFLIASHIESNACWETIVAIR